MQKVFWIKKVTVVAFYTSCFLYSRWIASYKYFYHFHQGCLTLQKNGDSCIVLDGTIYASPLDLDQSPILFHRTSVTTNMLQVELFNLAVLQMEAFL